MSGRLVKYLAEAASGDLSPDVLMSIMLFRVPSFLELVLPLGLFIGILLAYGRLYVDSEMTVMSACGLSTSRLAAYTLVPACCLAMLVGYISMFVTPAGITKVNQIFDDFEASNGLDSVVSGRFRVDEKTGRVTYVKAFSEDKALMKEVFTADPEISADGQVQLSVILAEQGYIEIPESYGLRYLVMENGRRYVGQPGQGDFQITEFEEYGQRLKQRRIQKRRSDRTDGHTFEQLMTSDRLDDKAAMQWRISLAILVPIISLIALALSKTSHRQGRYVKMLPAFLIYIIYIVSLNGARDAVEKGGLPVEVGMWWVHLIFFALALLLLFGGSWRRSFRASRARAARR